MDGISDDVSQSDSEVRIYFSDFFEIDPDIIEEYGAFNISLVNDLPLFIDPFLLFDSENEKYKALHEEIIKYVKFLKYKCLSSSPASLLNDQWFLFPEVCQNWLGFSKTGNKGSGLGRDFARSLQRNLTKIFTDFGEEKISKGTHLEKLCLVEGGVGRDHLSDFTTNLIKKYLLEYTQEFTRKFLNPKFKKIFAVNKVWFDYSIARWLNGKYELPFIGKDYVLLTPKDILTKDQAWINRPDLIYGFEDIYNSIPNEQLRAQVNDFFMRRLTEDMKEKERRSLAIYTLEKFPEVLDYFIKGKEDHAEDAHKLSNTKVEDTEKQFIKQIQFIVKNYLQGTIFYELGDSYGEALRRIEFLKDVIENNDGYKIFYLNGKPIKRENDLQILYRLTWCATKFDVNREVNNGRGPVDFKISKGSGDKSLVEFKLASNSQLKKNLAHQVEIYENANSTKKSIKVILYFSDDELLKVRKILKELGLDSSENIILIDACADNKPSASVANN
jgi:hypothetical protein